MNDIILIAGVVLVSFSIALYCGVYIIDSLVERARKRKDYELKYAIITERGDIISGLSLDAMEKTKEQLEKKNIKCSSIKTNATVKDMIKTKEKEISRGDKNV